MRVVLLADEEDVLAFGLTGVRPMEPEDDDEDTLVIVSASRAHEVPQRASRAMTVVLPER